MKRMRFLLAALVVATVSGTGVVSAAADPGDLGDLGGQETELSTDPGNPAPIRAGLWKASLAPGDKALQFVYERTQSDSTVILGVSARSTGETSGGVSIEATAEDGTNCGDQNTTGDFSVPFRTYGVELAIGTKEYGSRDSQCLTSKTITFQVAGPAYSDLTDPLDLAVKVVEESPLKDVNADLPVAPEVPPAFVAPEVGNPRDVTPGTTFDDAPVLEDGTVSGTVQEGEQVFYRVPLDWGQSLATQLDLAALPATVTEDGGDAGVQLLIYSPMRRMIGSGFDDAQDEGDVGEESLVLAAGRGPLLYRNRFDNGPTYLPGDYFVSVVAEPSSSREDNPADVPFELSVEVQGEVSGAPEFVQDQPYLIGVDQRSSVASGTPRAQAKGDEAWFTTRRIGGLGLGLVGVVLLALGALRLRS